MADTTFETLIANIRKKLPIQNPLYSYVHNNILLMFEGKDFHEALTEAGDLYRAKTYWPLEKYKEKYTEGKIADKDVFEAIDHYLARYKETELAGHLGLSEKEFFYRLMFSELAFNDDEIQPEINNQHMWQLCAGKMDGQSVKLKRSPKVWRAKKYWEKYYSESYVSTAQPFVIRLISSYLDQGQSFWGNPFINKGFWNFFCFDVETVGSYARDWMKVLKRKVVRYKNSTAEEVIVQELTSMGIPQEEWEHYLLDIMFDLKGWSGMVNKLEVEPWQASVKAPNIKLPDYIAALLLVESALDTYHSETYSNDLSLIYGRTEEIEFNTTHLTLALYQITKSFKLEERWMQKYQPSELVSIVEAIDGAEKSHLIRLWHEAFEHHFYRDALQALITHTPEKLINRDPKAQVLFCIDDREESLRRHVEETDLEIKTYGVVGFFGIDMSFSSLKNNRLIAQCPPVIMPSRVVKEVSINDSSSFDKFNMFRGGSNLTLYYNSRTLFRGFFSTIILGMASLFPMFMQVFFPNQSRKLQKEFFNAVSPEPVTEINIDQTDSESYGYTKAEQAKIVSTILNMCGFKAPFSRLVFMIGHGSSSTNNPFKQAYGCGACGGNAGIPNSRSFAKMANDPLVRDELKKLFYHIPDLTYFFSGFHDTCTDEIHYFDLQKVPASHQVDFDHFKKSLAQGAKLNAFERCQRFSSTKAKSSPEAALKHVKERSQDLAQPRPEYGHCTNSLAVVGRRDLTRGLFMNRRSFLLTYDWEIDPTGSILKDVVLGGIPVAVNINMDYYFSYVDNENFGCGSKLPLNMTSLLGVMTGSQSDLRIGMARQMIEIHEPIRNMTIIEAPLERVQTLFDSHPRLRNIMYNHWLRLVVCDPVSKQWYLFGDKEFRKIEVEDGQLKHYRSSIDMINQTHSEKDFAEIDS